MKYCLFYIFFLLKCLVSDAQVINKTDTTKPTQTAMAEIMKPPVDSNILIVVNGTVAGTIRELKKDISKTFPVDIIESIDVLKGFKATDKYGDKGKAGVLEFYLKNVKITDVTITEQGVSVDSVFNKVEIEAAFPGGDRAWRSYLERNVNANVPVDSSAPEGTYTVIVQFVVDKQGVISDVKALTKHGYGMEQEVIRIIRKGPNWVPAMQDGRPVKAYRRQPVTFYVASEDWYKLSTTKIPAGVATLVEIKGMDFIKDDELEVTVSSGTITRSSEKKYLIKADNPGKITLNITRKSKKKKEQTNYGSVEITVE